MSVFKKVRELVIEKRIIKIAEFTKKVNDKKRQIEENEQSKAYYEKMKVEYETILSESEDLGEKIKSLIIIRDFLKYFSLIQNLIVLFESKQILVELGLEGIKDIKDIEKGRNNDDEVIDFYTKLKDWFLKINETIQKITSEKDNNEYEILFEEKINTPFEKYYVICKRFQEAYNDLLDFLKKFTKVDINKLGFKETIGKGIRELNRIAKASEKVDLSEEDVNILIVNDFILKFWLEVKKLFNNEFFEKSIKLVNDFIGIGNFAELQAQYGEEVFNIEFLEKEIERLRQKEKEKQGLNKDISSLEASIRDCNKTRQRLNKEIKEQEAKIVGLVTEKEKLEKATTFEELGYRGDSKTTARNKAVSDLKLDTKDYVIIPIPPNVNSISDVFKKDKQIKIEVGEDTFFTYYTLDEAVGRINNTSHLNESDSVLMIPIKKIQKEHVNKVKNGEISLNSEVLQLYGIIVFMPGKKRVDFEGYTVDVHYFNESETTIYEKISDFLDYNLNDDYIDEIRNHIVFGDYNSKAFETQEQTNKNEAIVKCLFENFGKRPINWKKIKVDEEPKIFSSDFQKRLNTAINPEKIDAALILGVYSKIEEFLNGEQANTSCLVDEFYGQLLTEYMKINPKAKADYIEEEYTRVTINGRKLSIKPPLPPKKDEVIKRYSRSDEDIAYKIMKLAQIVNRFSKLEDSQNSMLSDYSYELKKKLIKRVIELSKKNKDKIKVRRKFDEKKSAWAIYLEIPGYTEIGLHVLEMTKEFKDFVLNDENTEQIVIDPYDIKGSSPILSYGVNIELLKALKKLPPDKRIQCCLNTEEDTLVKLITRMGYSKFDYLSLTSKEKKKEYLRKMLSDEILKRLMEMQEEER